MSGADLGLYDYLKNKLISKKSFVRAQRFYCSRGDTVNQYTDELSVKIFSLQQGSCQRRQIQPDSVTMVGKIVIMLTLLSYFPHPHMQNETLKMRKEKKKPQPNIKAKHSNIELWRWIKFKTLMSSSKGPGLPHSIQGGGKKCHRKQLLNMCGIP